MMNEDLKLDKYMTRVFVADTLPEERSALRLLLLDLKMEVVGESADWLTTFKFAPLSRPDMLLIDWNLLPLDPPHAIAALRAACSDPVAIVLISAMNSRQQTALSSGADAFISKSDTSERVAEHLQTVAAGILR
jgi:DNA-binding NarL/FixJ family response regulator